MNHLPRPIALALVASSLLLPACALDADPTAQSSDYALGLSTTDTARVLALVNYAGTDLATLDDAIGLDARAAKGIADYRAGSDGVLATADDRYFADLAEVDAIPYVGDAAFQKLATYAANHAAPADETVEGVSFRGWEAESVVWAVDHLDVGALDAILDARAAKGLVAARPFTTVAAMGPVPYVGSSALASLHAAAAGWWAMMRSSSSTPSLAGTFDGVAFDETTAEVALDIANAAAAWELGGYGVTSSPASHLIAARPYATLAAVAATSGIGTVTMTALHTYATSGHWKSGANACVDSFESVVAPHLPDLLLMSESDRPIDIVSFVGQGAQAPTPASVLALVGAKAGSTVEPRSTDDFAVTLEPSSGTADPNAAALVLAAVAAQLSDVIYVKVHAPQGDPYQAEVHVYLVGRTTCGDLVALHAISIET
jgi:hypothetical protein